MKGKFIVFEGLDGAGTTTQAAILEKHLKEKGFNVHKTAEPSTGPIGTIIRQILAGRLIPNSLSNSTEIDPKTIALLFAADRHDHIQNEIIPMLEKGTIVISDRYKISSLVYQGLFTHETQWVENLNKFVLNPDITFFLDIDGDTAFTRIYKNRSFFELYEKRQYMIDLALRYKDVIAQQHHSSIVNIDGTQPIDEIASYISTYLNNKL